MNIKTFSAFCLLPALAIGSAQAALITDSSDLVGSTTTIDFNQFVGSKQLNGINGPINIGTPTEKVQASTLYDPLTMWLTNIDWSLADNGSWNSGRDGFLGTSSTASQNVNPVKIVFESGNISGFGFFMNYFLDANTIASSVSLSAYDSGATLLEEFTINPAGVGISTFGFNEGAFRGIQRDTADIDYILLTASNAVFDNLQFTRSASVPEPASIALLLAGLAGIGYTNKKRQKR